MRAFVFAILWCAIVSLGCAANLILGGWDPAGDGRVVLINLATGAFAGGWLGHAFSELVGQNRPPTARFALFFVSVAAATVGLALLFFYFGYRAYFSQWHATPVTLVWVIQNIYTAVGTAYLFLSTALRLYLPWSVLALAIAAYGFAHRRFPAAR